MTWYYTISEVHRLYIGHKGYIYHVKDAGLCQTLKKQKNRQNRRQDIQLMTRIPNKKISDWCL